MCLQWIAVGSVAVDRPLISSDPAFSSLKWTMYQSALQIQELMTDVHKGFLQPRELDLF